MQPGCRAGAGAVPALRRPVRRRQRVQRAELQREGHRRRLAVPEPIARRIRVRGVRRAPGRCLPQSGHSIRLARSVPPRQPPRREGGRDLSPHRRQSGNDQTRPGERRAGDGAYRGGARIRVRPDDRGRNRSRPSGRRVHRPPSRLACLQGWECVAGAASREARGEAAARAQGPRFRARGPRQSRGGSASRGSSARSTDGFPSGDADARVNEVCDANRHLVAREHMVGAQPGACGQRGACGSARGARDGVPAHDRRHRARERRRASPQLPWPRPRPSRDHRRMAEGRAPAQALGRAAHRPPCRSKPVCASRSSVWSTRGCA